ncbi:hypothetical protein H6CHR_02305 [Variovorax sp. PBL-H6]|uniref:hypothetical protein n=1 Tax=Variovorax sp. PBL-H6 TaxID=434009 RepID=UPI00131883B2|nr:hypothetical protein [Variovorax sp. PBL-H6]VTU24998.1 hypothetical protein H6CHR_02305 [Variovorax sp. PBL-H6]
MLQAAHVAVEKARAYIAAGGDAVPYFSPTDLAALSPGGQEDALHAEEKVYEAHPERAAIHFCMSSSTQLLELSRSLLDEPHLCSPAERMSRHKKLVNDAKAAGRGAYRAALILSSESVDSCTRHKGPTD